MRRFRRRRRNGTWFPTFGGEYIISSGGGAGTFNPTGITFGFTNLQPGLNLSISALTYDEPREPGAVQTSTTSLLDVLGEEWFLKRIVGKFFAARISSAVNDPGTDPGQPLLVALGFFVSRADVTTPNLPNGFNALSNSDAYAQYHPLAAQTQREPWLFRRTWLLGTNANGAQFQNIGGTNFQFGQTNNYAWPVANWQYGSQMDGPHLDIRTKRRISNDDRLYAAVGVEVASPFGVQAVSEGPTFQGYLDYRIFGDTRKARNRGVF